MSKEHPSVTKVHPRVEVTTHTGNAETTRGHSQKSEAHYGKIVNKAVNHDAQTTYSAKRKR